MIGILAVLATVTLLVLNPAQMVKQSRDANRVTEINQINQALLLYQALGGSTGMGTTGKIYVSIPCDSPDYSSLPTPLNGYTYACSNSSSYRNVDGTGWIPVNLTAVQASAGTLFSALPIDPLNTVANGYYYTYIPGSWALSATMESDKYLSENAANDGGKSATRFELGNEIALDANLGTYVAGGIVNPSITSISPGFAYNSASVSLTSITGTGFASGATVKLTQSGQLDINCTGFIVASATSITGGSCPITGIASGTWNVVVTNTDTGTGTGSNLFSVFNATGLVGYLKFDDGSGSTAIDSSGYGNTGTLYNGASWTLGKVNGALNFDSTLISAVDQPLPSLAGSSISIALWVYRTNLPSDGWYDPLISRWYWSGINARQYQLVLASPEVNPPYTYEVNWMISTDCSTQSNMWSTSLIPMNTWTHIAVTYDRVTGTGKIYINGQLDKTATLTPGGLCSSLGTYPQQIAAKRDSIGGVLNQPYGGKLDEVAVYSRALSDAEILAIYNAQK